MTRALPSKEVIDSWLAYDPLTGVFVWKRQPMTGRVKLGAAAGTRRKSGYVAIGLHGFGQHFAHRLAWITKYGPIPPGFEIDHRDGNPSNNAIGNLRLATSSQQKRNKRVQSNSSLGLKGAFYHACHKGKKWRSQIKVGDRLIFLGYYHTAEEAHRAYAQAALEYFGDFARAA